MNVVIFGGGNGLSTTLKGLKEIKDINIAAVVTVADSGGSTGEIRKYYNSPALGDLRRVVVALSKKETVLNELMEYRFPEQGLQDPFNNHSLGNIIMLALNNMNGFYEGIRTLSKIFNISGEAIPLTNDVSCEIQASYTDGSVTVSEHNIPNTTKKIEEISYVDKDSIKVNPRVLEVIEDADLIVFSFGSLYTSIIASFILPEVKEALIKNKDKKFAYLCNIMTQPGETDNMSAYEHIKAIEKHLEYGIIDYIIINNEIPSQQLVDKYQKAGSSLILADKKIKDSHASVLELSLIDNNNETVLRHDIKKIKKAFLKLLKTIKGE